MSKLRKNEVKKLREILRRVYPELFIGSGTNVPPVAFKVLANKHSNADTEARRHAVVSQTAFQFTLDFLTSKPVVIVPSTEQVSSNAGLLPFRRLDERLGLNRQFAEALEDRRHESYGALRLPPNPNNFSSFPANPHRRLQLSPHALMTDPG